MPGIEIKEEDQDVFDRLKSTGRITRQLKRLMIKQWNKCSICQSETPHGRPTFAGYNKEKEAIFAGACCAHNIFELASPTYAGVTSTLNIAVPDEVAVWRYMDFPKFVAMLAQKGLYFSRADKLEDSFEGATGLARREEDWDQFYLDFFRTAVATPPPGVSAGNYSVQYIEGEAQRLLRSWKAAGRRDRSKFVSCWHANTGESEALWSLYCPPSTASIAIRTTVRSLWDATENDQSSVVGRVHYMDFKKRFADPNYRIFCKRASLSHENEIRIVIHDESKILGSGKTIPCDLNTIIDCVVISFSVPMTGAVRRKFPAVFRADLDGAIPEQGRNSLSEGRSFSGP